MPIATLTIDLNAKLANLQASFDKAAQLSEKSAKRMESAFKGAGTALAALGAGVALAGIVASIRSVVDEADNFSKLSQRVGISAESLSKLAYAGNLSDVSLEQLQGGLLKLSKNMADTAAGTGEAKEAFAALGINVRDSSGNLKSADTVLAEVADKFAGYKDSAAKAALAQKLFGKSGADLIPLLNSGAAGLREMGDEAARLGVVISDDLAKKSADLNDNITRLQTSLRGITVQLSGPLIEGFSGFATEVLKATQSIDGFARSLNAVTNVKIGAAGIDTSKPIKDQIDQLDELIASNETWKKRFPGGIVGSVFGIRGETLEDMRKVLAGMKAAKDLEDQIAFAGPSGTKTLTDAPGISKTDKSPKAKAQKEYDAALEISRRAADAYASSIEKMAAAQQSAEESVLTLTPAQKALRDMLQDPVWQGMPDAWKETALQQSYAAIETEKVAAQQKRLNELLDAAPSATLEKQREDMKLLAAAFETGAISADKYAEAASQALGLNEKAKDSFEELKNVIEGWGKDAAQAMVDFAITGKSSFSDMTQSILSDIAKMLVYKNITAPLANQISGANWGAIGSAVAGFFGFADGGVMTNSGPIPLKRYASGGIAKSTQLAMFGEGSTPEAYVPLPDGRTIPGTMRGAGTVVQINVQNNAGDVAKATATSSTDSSGNTQILVMVEKMEGLMGQRIRKGTGLAPVFEDKYGLNPAAGARW